MARTRGRAAAVAVASGVPMVGVMAVGVLAVASCGHPPKALPPVQVMTPRVSASPLKLAPAEADGLTRFDSWPKACELLTDQDLRAVLPEVTQVEQTPHEQRIRVTNLGQGAGDDDRDAPGATCETRFWVAGAERTPHARPDLVRVEDIVVGDTDTVQDNYNSLAQHRPRVPGGLGATECVLAGTEYYCRMPHIAFAVGTGPTLSIDGFAGQPAKTEAQAYWVRTVLPELVRSVAAKLPRR